MQGISCLPVKLLLIAAILITHASASHKIGETCSMDHNCEDGLMCATCAANGNTRPRCIRTKPTNPTAKVQGLPFNKYSWLTTHNSFAVSRETSGTGSLLLAPTNQEDSITDQLNHGVRGLMLDMYDFNSDIWLCHSFKETCFNVTAFEPAINVLREIKAFLKENPTEIVTIFIEDYVKSPNGLTKVFNASGLNEYWFPLSEMPKKGEDWPTVDDMVNKNHRLVVFTSDASKEASEKIAYEWNYVVESQYGNDGMKSNSCPSRSESPQMNDRSRSLVLMNYFPTNPDESRVCLDNSNNLIRMTQTCYEASGKRWQNFIAVDFYKRSDGGGASAAVDKANGHLTCGCDSIAYCRVNAKYGTCDVPVYSPPPPAQQSASPLAEVEWLQTTSNSPISVSLHLSLFTSTVLSMLLLLRLGQLLPI